MQTKANALLELHLIPRVPRFPFSFRSKVNTLKPNSVR
jgi:hypothetical protein